MERDAHLTLGADKGEASMTLAVGTVIVALVGLLMYRGLTRSEPSSPFLMKRSAMRDPALFRNLMMFLVTVAVGASSLYVILSGKFDNGTQKWAFGAVGSMIGFWLRPGR